MHDRSRSIDSIIASAPALAPSSLSRGAGPDEPFYDFVAKIQANDGEWRTALLSLVASAVSQGMRPGAIRAFAPLFTASGYSVTDTLSDMEPMIAGAIAKYSPDKKPAGDAIRDYFNDWYRYLEPPEYIVKGLIAVGDLFAVISPPKMTKSFLTMYMALCIATGRSCFGLSVKQGGVLLVCGERGRTQKKRGAALAQAWGLDLQSHLPLRTYERPLSLYSNDADLSAIIDAVNDMIEHDGSCRMVIIDTLATVNGGADDVKDMPAMVAALIRLQAALPETAIVVVHHSSAANPTKARGRSDFLGAIDGQLVVEKDALLSTVKLGAANDVSIPFDHSYSIEDQEVGIDRDGETIKVGYLQPAALSPQQQADRVYGATVMDRMARILRAHSQHTTAPLTKEQWFDAGILQDVSTAEKVASKKASIRRAMKNIIDDEILCEQHGDGYRWSPFDTPLPSPFDVVYRPVIDANIAS